MKKSIPSAMFGERDQVRLSSLQGWILDHGVTEIVMTERQFWKFSSLQPVAEKPWTTFMGRAISVPDMPEASQKHLGLFDKNSPGQMSADPGIIKPREQRDTGDDPLNP